MSDQAVREMTPEEIAARDAGCDEKRLAEIIHYAEQRGFQRGRRSISPALEHFEIAYRYAQGAKERMQVVNPPEGMSSADYVDDAFQSAKIMADIAYSEWFRAQPPAGKPIEM